MTSTFCWQNSVSPFLASFFTLRPNLSVTPGIYLLTSYTCIPVPYDEKDIFFFFLSFFFFLVFILKVLICHHRTAQLHLLWRQWWGIYSDYCDIEWFALEMNRGHFVSFANASKYCISESFVEYESYFISSKGFLPTVIEKMVI